MKMSLSQFLTNDDFVSHPGKFVIPLGTRPDDTLASVDIADIPHMIVSSSTGARVILQTGRKAAKNKAFSGLSFLNTGRRARVNQTRIPCLQGSRSSKPVKNQGKLQVDQTKLEVG